MSKYPVATVTGVASILALIAVGGCHPSPPSPAPQPETAVERPAPVGAAVEEAAVADPSPAGSSPEAAPNAPTKFPDEAAPEPLELASSDKSNVEGALVTWMKGLPKPLAVRIKDTPIYAPATKAHRVSDGDWHVTINFSQPLAAGASHDDIRAALNYWTANHVAPITAQDWDFRFRTPSSSSSEGMEVVDTEDGAAIRITGRFYALSGRKKTAACEPIPDRGLPDDCYVSIEQDVPFVIQVPVPFES